jgi:hypothetical protein
MNEWNRIGRDQSIIVCGPHLYLNFRIHRLLLLVLRENILVQGILDRYLEIKFGLGTKKFNGCGRSRNHPDFALRDFAVSMKDTY